MQIKGEKYHVGYNPETSTIFCEGMLNLRGKDGYKDIANLFDQVVKQNHSAKITVDVRELEFLNSSGITTLGGFIIKLRKKGGICLTMKCSNSKAWQERSMIGLERLMPTGLALQFE